MQEFHGWPFLFLPVLGRLSCDFQFFHLFSRKTVVPKGGNWVAQMKNLIFAFIFHEEHRFRYVLFIKKRKYLNPGSQLFPWGWVLISRLPLKILHLFLTNLKTLTGELLLPGTSYSDYLWIPWFCLHYRSLELGR